MSSNTIRLVITTASALVLVSMALVVRAHLGGSSPAGSAAAATAEQGAGLGVASATTPAQQNAVSAEQFFPAASRAFEPFLLLLLGSILLSIATVIKVLLTRKLKQR